MEGIEGVTTKVLARLQEAMPAKLAELRIRYGVDDGSLEDITTWLTHEPDDIGVDTPPMVVVTEQESDIVSGPERIRDDGAGGATYRFRYRIGVFAWARGDTFDSTARARARYGLAVREILLQKIGLGDPDPGTCVLDPAWIVETYSSIGRDGISREVIAATALVLKYETQEWLAPRTAPLGVAGSIPPDVGIGP